uniref:ENHANCER OF AG-4 protein 2 n=1 Tax=Rhizophora mucronata TaxID=61149 RepID=A0A2P2MEI9_RHIMU
MTEIEPWKIFKEKAETLAGQKG